MIVTGEPTGPPFDGRAGFGHRDAGHVHEDPGLVLAAQRLDELLPHRLAALLGEELLDLRRNLLHRTALDARLILLVPGGDFGVGHFADLALDLGLLQSQDIDTAGGCFGLHELLLDEAVETLLEELLALLLELRELRGEHRLEIGHGDDLAVDFGDRSVLVGCGRDGGRLGGGALVAGASRQDRPDQAEQGERRHGGERAGLLHRIRGLTHCGGSPLGFAPVGHGPPEWRWAAGMQVESQSGSLSEICGGSRDAQGRPIL